MSRQRFTGTRNEAIDRILHDLQLGKQLDIYDNRYEQYQSQFPENVITTYGEFLRIGTVGAEILSAGSYEKHINKKLKKPFKERYWFFIAAFAYGLGLVTPTLQELVKSAILPSKSGHKIDTASSPKPLQFESKDSATNSDSAKKYPSRSTLRFKFRTSNFPFGEKPKPFSVRNQSRA